MAANREYTERDPTKERQNNHELKRWKPAEAKQRLKEWKRSGLSVAEFCRRNQLECHRFHWWKNRYRDWIRKDEEESDTESTAQIRWVEAQVQSYRRELRAEVVIRLRTGDEIEVLDTGRTPADWLSLVIRGLPG